MLFGDPGFDSVENIHKTGVYLWDANLLQWIKSTGSSSVGTDVSVLNFPSTYDVSDRAARLLGVVYGSQGQQILQRASTFDTQVQLRTAGTEYDARQIRALTASDIVAVNNAFLLDATFTGRINTQGQKAMAASTPVVVASDQSAVPVSGTVTANQGTASANDWRSDLRRGLTIAFASVDVAANGDNTIVAADATRKIKVLSYVLVADGTVTSRWKSGAGTNLSGAMSWVANTGVASMIGTPAGGHIMETAVNQALVLNLGSAIGVRGHLSYFLE